MSNNTWMPNNSTPGPRRPQNATGQQQGPWQQPGQAGPAGGGQGGTSRSRTTNRNRSRSYHFHISDPGVQAGDGGPRNGRGQQQGGGQGQGQGQRGGRMHSPLGDPEFFSNVDIRNYCESGRGLFLQMSFELANAAEMLNAVLKEVPDPEGRPFGSRARARRVSKRMKKAAEDALGTAKNLAATYAAFQREFDPQLAPHARPRQGRRFDFNG
ncbi:plasmid transfer protein TraA [Streptomyces sp. NPDC093514]|uniref:plasmid transfer protein TraA n=1 Tax=Streptomyces sp. NPDC093514 TaxID=3366039 RepID=UPI003821C200